MYVQYRSVLTDGHIQYSYRLYPIICVRYVRTYDVIIFKKQKSILCYRYVEQVQYGTGVLFFLNVDIQLRLIERTVPEVPSVRHLILDRVFDGSIERMTDRYMYDIILYAHSYGIVVLLMKGL